MKLVVAIIRPEKLEDVQKALNAVDVYLMTVSDVRGCGRQRGYTEVYRGQEIQIRLLPKVKLEIAVNEAFVEATVEAFTPPAPGTPAASATGRFSSYRSTTRFAFAPANAEAPRSARDFLSIFLQLNCARRPAENPLGVFRWISISSPY